MNQTTENTNSPLPFYLFLQEEFKKRQFKNSNYSLRSFARLLSLDSSSLSKILSGRRQVSPMMFRHLSDRLALPPDVKDVFGKNIQETRGKSSRASRNVNINRTAPNYAALEQDKFNAISEWYHFAILELTHTKDFEGSIRWIAKRLGITPAAATLAIERLKRLELLSVDENGKWIDTYHDLTNFPEDVSAAANRKLQKEILEKAILALEEIDIAKRSQSAMTMAIDSRKLTEAKKKIREFRRDLCAFLQDGDVKDAVYNLSLTLYPLTQEFEV